ncbi:hypothetical protein BAE44_0023303 [Dichanthelium oligosanthes]|uniref:Uncharacterized protein n=1 Tax=Dichanthelium oligosanthes TaxID=888268 RepID=A0A1E5US75_9POAL|nr:hypothetical protein BAE44_0023303 [Dichanthelium oligosanthes]
MHTARVRFLEGAPEHEVSVGCATTSGGGEELWVSVDVLWDLHSEILWLDGELIGEHSRPRGAHEPEEFEDKLFSEILARHCTWEEVMEKDIGILRELPSLMHLQFQIQQAPKEKIIIHGGMRFLFPALVNFQFKCERRMSVPAAPDV